MANFKPRDRDKYMVREEFAKLVHWAEARDPRLALFIFLGGAAGLRITETRTLPWTAFDRLESERAIVVLSLKKRKRMADGSSKKVIRYSDVVVDPASRARIAGYIKKIRRRGDKWVFPGREDGPLSIRQATKWFKKAVLGAGLNPNYSYHALRHYRGISLWQANRDIDTVKKLMRHEEAVTTYKYMHMSNEEQRKAVDKTRVI